MKRIGIDVGGTNTDAVLIDGRKVIAGVKSATTEDVTGGVLNALRRLIEDIALDPQSIDVIMIGTTHFTNAVVEGKALDPVAALRIALPATACLPPMIDWPDDLRQTIGNHAYLAKGGYEFDGRKIAELDPAEIERIAQACKAKGLSNIAISSVFGPLNSEMEKEAEKIIRAILPEANITLSADIGRIGLLERENAGILNACLQSLSSRVIQAFDEALKEAGFVCPFHLTQNDGTLLSAAQARRYPVLTFASGPTNSMRGAAFLTGVKDAIVVDVGGTTTDIGALRKGFPRPASLSVEVGGVRTNFRMPDVFSIGLGGGSLVRETEGGGVTVGPQSVGFRLTTEALVFGGDTLTTSDIAVATGAANFGDHSKVKHLPKDLIAKVRARIGEMLFESVDRARLSSEPLPVIVVGGGSMLVPDTLGELNVVRPENYAVANAVGAAIAQVGGEVDRIESLGEQSRSDVMHKAKQEAIAKAIEEGADPESTEIVDMEDLPLAYLPGNATRIKVKAVGELMHA